ncbi:B12-binding domain-containing radical SAM protein [Prosthecochloris sp. GSB1]|uniref:B12-binding domain-containing radical SAM protein n=1 Tax=Prosthecochloris sp. GSB1 TaxID=281093 RepID=UPI000B8CECE7|nr:radical SAM protein [Prosthecochloris sp. GSB1]ASQ91382.1 B12-binding domain-containing radical SAM protein [Prosthecochloris sp. GSB1]
MDAPKKVLLVFIASESGVDGARSVHGEGKENGPFGWFDRSVRSLIKQTQFAIPSLGLTILASIEVDGVEQRLCDLRFEELPVSEQWDLIGISVQTGLSSKAFDIADTLRAKGFRVALGGAHATLFPESCRPHADVLVHGEADDIWRDVLEDLRDGRLKRQYRPAEFPDLSVPRPVNSRLLDKKRYFTTNLVQTGRGCPWHCDFCNVHVLNGNSLRRRGIEDIVREVERFREYDDRIFFFVDDSINANEEYAGELFSRIAPLGITWFGQATTALGRQPRLLETFARSGCQALLTGIESIEPASRISHRKNRNRPAELAESIISIRKAGISLYGSFIYGLDGDTLDTPAAILDFVKETGLDVPGINILRPNPGTRVFDRLREEGRLLFDPDDLGAYRYTFGQELLYRPKNIAPGDFIESYSKLTSKLFTIRNSLKRGLAAPRAKAAVLLFNLFYTHLYTLSRKDLGQQRLQPD